jgi:DNA-binding NarL/FixJ family response regulator
MFDDTNTNTNPLAVLPPVKEPRLYTLGEYLRKEERSHELHEYENGIMSPSIARRTLQLLANPNKSTKSEPQHDLSTRELEILELLVEGLEYKEIAQRLFLSSHTVRTHIYNIYKKLQVTSKSQAVSLALKNQWI